MLALMLFFFCFSFEVMVGVSKKKIVCAGAPTKATHTPRGLAKTQTIPLSCSSAGKLIFTSSAQALCTCLKWNRHCARA